VSYLHDIVCNAVPPEITTHLKSEEGVQGSNLTLNCRGSGLPAPKYEFRKVEKLLPPLFCICQ